MADFLVSVITPAYNVERYISDAIESILAQSFRDFEYVVIDDCSTDRTWEIIQSYAKKDSRIRASRNEKNLGIAGNRNAGLRQARGKYIVWQDADDLSVPLRIKKQLVLMEAHPEVGIVGGFIEMFDERGSRGVRMYAPDDASVRRTIFRYSPVAQPASMVRKACFDEVGEFDLRYPPAEDLDISFRIGVRHKFANLQEVMIRYREHPASSTFTRLRKIETSTLEIRKKFAKSGYYYMTISDRLYNLLQAISIWTVPPRLKIWVFDKIRNRTV